ncbi:MAG: hypothetical protein U0P82_00420 [Vicinamibacterales bacterium]
MCAAASLQAQTTGVMLPVPPLPPIGLPLPHIGLPPSEHPVDEPHKDAEGDAPKQKRRRGAPPTVVIVAPPVVAVPAQPPPAMSRQTPAVPDAAAPALKPVGTLDLQVSGADRWQLFVDGYYAGTSDELGSGVVLEPGPHAVELRADGYQSHAFKVRVPADRHVVYQHAFVRDPNATPGSPATAPARPMTVYIIPGCYAGNVDPARATLPKDCDPARTTVLER